MTTSISSTISTQANAAISREPSGLVASLAETEADVRDSQRLRYRIFAQEQGARLQTLRAGLDADRYDDFCRHILVRDAHSGDVVASTRVLLDTDAKRAGGFYSENEFALDALLRSAGPVMEIGRTCVHPAYRSGAAISLLWAALARYIDLGSYQYMIGCASIPMHDGGVAARNAYALLSEKYLLSPEQRVIPRQPLPDNVLAFEPGMGAVQLPPLLKAYIRLGARIGGEPCQDPDFNCADLLIVLSPARVARKYARHFMERDAEQRKVS